MTNFSNSLQCQIVISDQFKLMATLTCICSVSSDTDMKILKFLEASKSGYATIYVSCCL